jgi:hypothetical protein
VVGLVVAVLVLGGVAFAAVRGAGEAGGSGGNDGRPNVLVVVTDDARAETLQVMPKTRRWLADGGVAFTKGFATTPSCCPSRASILSGRRHEPAANHFGYSLLDLDRADPFPVGSPRLP